MTRSPHWPPLVAVAHGSRDPRSAASIATLLELVRARAPEVDIRAAFLDLSAPRLPDALRALAGEGHREVVVVPLLLGRAYHARVDVPALIAEATIRQPLLSVRAADVLGPDRRLESVALRRLLATGVRPGDAELGVLLAGAGSSTRSANAAVSSVAERWAASCGWAGVTAAFASVAEPDVPAGIEQLRARGARRIAVASWFLAPGLLPDRVADQTAATAAGAPVAAPLGVAPELADLVLDRYRHAALAADEGRLRYA